MIIPDNQTLKFDDLKFEPHCQEKGGVDVPLFFSNGYGVYVSGGIPPEANTRRNFGDGITTFEVLVIKGDPTYWDPAQDPRIKDETLKFQTKDQVMAAIEQVRQLPAAKKS